MYCWSASWWSEKKLSYSQLKVTTMDNYNSTKDPLLNTQTCLKDPYIETSEGGHIRMNRGGGMGG